MHYNYKFFSLCEKEKSVKGKQPNTLAMEYLVFLLNTDYRIEENFKF